MTALQTIFSELDPISFHEMDRVSLMNRRDTKYWFHIDQLSEILNGVKTGYFVLSNGEGNLFSYSNIYYDTADNLMYKTHHNGKLNRYKVRRRRYDRSGDSFLEVKFKTNKKQTVKSRISAPFSNTAFSEEEQLFLKECVPFAHEKIHPVLQNRFQRVTLVSKNFNERCTIDFNLHFNSNNLVKGLNELVIVEVKTEGVPRSSVLAKVLLKQRVKPSGYSKYCMGRTLTDRSLKNNRFKEKLRRLDRIVNKTTNNLK